MPQPEGFVREERWDETGGGGGVELSGWRWGCEMPTRVHIRGVCLCLWVGAEEEGCFCDDGGAVIDPGVNTVHRRNVSLRRRPVSEGDGDTLSNRSWVSLCFPGDLILLFSVFDLFLHQPDFSKY